MGIGINNLIISTMVDEVGCLSYSIRVHAKDTNKMFEFPSIYSIEGDLKGQIDAIKMALDKIPSVRFINQEVK